MKNQQIKSDEQRELALAIIEALPTKMQTFARRAVDK
jgi:hypothetical protein